MSLYTEQCISKFLNTVEMTDSFHKTNFAGTLPRAWRQPLFQIFGGQNILLNWITGHVQSSQCLMSYTDVSSTTQLSKILISAPTPLFQKHHLKFIRKHTYSSQNVFIKVFTFNLILKHCSFSICHRCCFRNDMFLGD